MSIVENKKLNFTLALLIFGRLSESAAISLKSIVNLNANKICILADTSGENWIRQYKEKYNLPTICVHKPIETDLQSLGLNLSEVNEYSEFGKERFIKLTTFKWYLLSDILIRHNELNGALFSDLDVLWRNFPKMLDGFSEENGGLAFIQDDSPLKSEKKHFCTGVMYWKNSEISKGILNELFTAQKQNIQNGNLIPDEPTFNNWYLNSKSSERIISFSNKEVVIGHRFLHLCTNQDLFNYKSFSCFHANYVVGEARKFLLLDTLSKRINGEITWIFGAIIYLIIKVSEKIKFMELGRRKNGYINSRK